MTLHPRRAGSQTKTQIQQVALRLFTERGYDATSLREIAEALSITKASLYYHFKSKEQIVKALIGHRTSEAKALLEWVRVQPRGTDLLRDAAMRWLEAEPSEKLRGVRFLNANPRITQLNQGDDIGDALEAVLEHILGAEHSIENLLLARLAFSSLNATAIAAEGTSATDETIVATARTLAATLASQVQRKTV
jgi:AcrR family transcriptional regulator